MSVAMTYNSLLRDVRNYLERGYNAVTDPIVYEQLPFLVNLAERRISREVKVQGFQNVVLVDVNTNVLQKPDRWRETLNLNVIVPYGTAFLRRPMFSRSYEYIRAHFPDESVTGTPAFYADYNYNNWLLAPFPSQTCTLEIVYNEISPFLDDDTQENWVTEYAPNLLLYAVLLEASPFLKNDERIATWQMLYDRALQSLSTEDIKKITDRSTSRQEI